MPKTRFGVLLLMLAALAGCDEQADSAHPEKIRILAIEYPLADIARQVGGERVEIEWIVESGMTPEHLHITPQLRGRLDSSELVLLAGTVDTWAGGSAGAGLANSRDVLSLLPLYKDEKFPDPPDYLWLDPVLASTFAKELSGRLSLLDTSHADYFQSNATSFTLDLDKLIKEFQPLLGADLRTRKFLAMDDYWQSIARRFELQQVWLNLRTPAQRLSDQQIRQIIQTAGREKTDVLVVAADMPPGLVQHLADKTGLRIVPLDPFGTSDRFSGERHTYVQLLRYNLQQLVDALK